PLGDSTLAAVLMSPLKGVKLRSDLRVPVLTVVAENDVLGWPPIPGYHAARQADTNRLRVWEVAGTAHADNYTFTVGFLERGALAGGRARGRVRAAGRGAWGQVRPSDELPPPAPLRGRGRALAARPVGQAGEGGAFGTAAEAGRGRGAEARHRRERSGGRRP